MEQDLTIEKYTHPHVQHCVSLYLEFAFASGPLIFPASFPRATSCKVGNASAESSRDSGRAQVRIRPSHRSCWPQARDSHRERE